MATTSRDGLAERRQDVSTSQNRAPLDDTDRNAISTVLEIAERVPESYRQAYLDGIARVLDDRTLVDG